MGLSPPLGRLTIAPLSEVALVAEVIDPKLDTIDERLRDKEFDLFTSLRRVTRFRVR